MTAAAARELAGQTEAHDDGAGRHWTALRLRVLGALAAAGLLLGGCAVNPATGERQFTGLMPVAQEAAVGAEQHPQILEEFGGEVQDPEIRAYVDRLGQRLAANTERSDVKYTFTVLDSDVVNAFALPGGYVYITRGLMALANSEAQLAGVIGHEIGHITGRHTAERYSRGTVAQVGAVLASVLGGAELGQLAAQGAQYALAGWGRGQELEADQLGIRYMANAGYDPMEMARFLDTMGRHAQLEALLAGQPGAADSFNYLQTHPPTGERVERASAAVAQNPGQDWIVNSEEYLRRIDGLLYGDNPEHGFVRDRMFVHPTLGFRFEVPEGFRLLNGTQQVTAIGPQQQAQIIFDVARSQSTRDPVQFLTGEWAGQAQLSGVQSLSVNGRPAATGLTRANTNQGAVDVRLVAIQWDNSTFYRFLFASAPQATASLDRDFQQVVNSFRTLSQSERSQFRPYRLRTVSVRSGETAEDYIRRMPFSEYAEERFRVLNNIPPGQQLQPGQLIKIVTEG